MRLRNKKTGEIGDLMGTERSCPYITIGVDFHDGNPRAFDYTSLAELNEEWEDYKPVKLLKYYLINEETGYIATFDSEYDMNEFIQGINGWRPVKVLLEDENE